MINTQVFSYTTRCALAHNCLPFEDRFACILKTTLSTLEAEAISFRNVCGSLPVCMALYPERLESFITVPMKF